MAGILIDTHALVWGQFKPSRLSQRARAAIETAGTVWVSAISFFEIAQKARLGKWPEIADALDEIAPMHERRGGQIVSVEADIALSAARLEWVHRDPFDRLIAATALSRRMTLVSADAAFDEVRALKRVW